VTRASINYLHFGEPKSWFTIRPEHRAKFELLMSSLLPEFFRDCPQFLRHKEFMISPALLKSHNIPVMRVTQVR
jgi:jumonji domain-containing protein 2